MTCTNKSPPLGLGISNYTVSAGVVHRGVLLGVGNPYQIVSLDPSVSDDGIWLYNSADCSTGLEKQCAGNVGAVYDSSKSRTYKEPARDKWNGTRDSDDPDYIYFNDDIAFGNTGNLTQFPLMTFKSGKYTAAGLGTSSGGAGIGLGAQSTFLSALVQQGLAPYKAYGIWVGSTSITQPVNGSLWIGGYDSARVVGGLNNFTEFDTIENCETCTEVVDVTYNYLGNSTSLMANSSDSFQIIIQPYWDTLQLPPHIFGNFYKAAQNPSNIAYLGAGLGTGFQRNAQLGNLTVTLKNGYKTTIPYSELYTPPRKVDSTGVYGIANNTYTLAKLQNTTSTRKLRWGTPFLTMNYLIVDHDVKKFKLAAARQGPYFGSTGALPVPLCSGLALPPASTNIFESPASQTASVSSGGGGGGTNVAAIAGGVGGGIGGLLIIGLLVWFILRGKKREKNLKAQRDSAVMSGGQPAYQQGYQQGYQQPYSQAPMSSYPPSSPTVMSEVHAGSKAHDSYVPNENIDKWLNHTQKEPVELHNPTDPATKAAATVQGPVEMPAYAYR